MSDGIYSALSGAVAAERTLELVANNVANVGTAGFRGERMAFRESVSRAAAAAAASATATAGPAGATATATAGAGGTVPNTLHYVTTDETRIDLTPGPLDATGNPLDFAISGDAFFAIRGDNGERYTRAGAFLLGTDGVLRTRMGEIVENAAARDPLRSEIRVPRGTLPTNIVVAPDGTLSAGDTVLGRMRLVRFAQPTDLRPEGGANLVAIPGARPLPTTEATVVQGYVEAANVSPISGMNEMILASRNFDAFQRVIQAFRQIDERAARDLAKGG